MELQQPSWAKRPQIQKLAKWIRKISEDVYELIARTLIFFGLSLQSLPGLSEHCLTPVADSQASSPHQDPSSTSNQSSFSQIPTFDFQ